MSNLLLDSKTFLASLRRTGWALFVAALGVLVISASGRQILEQQLGVLAWKLVLVGTGIFVAHRARLQLFPYIDLSALTTEHDNFAGLVFLGTTLLAGAIILALSGGL